SAIHALRIGPNTFLNSTAVWGYNKGGSHPSQHSLLVESALSMNTTTVYGKYEWVEKSTEELLLEEAAFGHGTIFPVNALTLGIQQRLVKEWKTNIAVGVQGSWYNAPNQLEGIYGKNPLALQVYLRIFPGLMSKG